VFPPLYAVLDVDMLRMPPADCAESFAGAGVKLIQYRAKHASARECFDACVNLLTRLAERNMRLIVNDRPDIAVLAGTGGVHVGQEDLPPDQARRICGQELWVGVSTHNLEQVRAANLTSANYIAVGPIFSTSTKENPDPVVGTEFIREARKLTRKPIVAIGGITLDHAAEVYEAGANSIAAVRDLLSAPDPGARAREFLAVAERTLRNSRAKAGAKG
jgi:thiamine-phosphate pyrophosphorylase